WVAFLHSPAWAAINLLPPGLAARSTAAASRGEWLLATELLAAVLLFSVVTIYLAGWLVEKVYAGEVVSPTIRRTPVPAAPLSPAAPTHAPAASTAAVPARAAGFQTLVQLPPVVEAVMEKELRYIMREPYFKIALMNLV